MGLFENALPGLQIARAVLSSCCLPGVPKKFVKNELYVPNKDPE